MVIGTVDFVTIILYLFRFCLIELATLKTYFRSALLVFLFIGVPTQINIISEFFIEDLISVENFKRFCFEFLKINSSRPGS